MRHLPGPVALLHESHHDQSISKIAALAFDAATCSRQRPAHTMAQIEL